MNGQKSSVWCEIDGPCPACREVGRCTRSADGTAILCRRAESARPVKQRDGSTAWLHAATGGSATSTASHEPRAGLTRSDIESLIKSHRTAVNPERLADLAKTLGVSVRSLQTYGVGWDWEKAAWSFPMYDFDPMRSAKPGGGLVPVGLRLRSPDGHREACVPGSRNGLFVPDGYSVPTLPADMDFSDRRPLMLLLPEGPADCCAAFDLGFRAVGRPSCSGGRDQVRRLMLEGEPQEVLVVGENDGRRRDGDGSLFWPGIEGAVSLIRMIAGGRHLVRFVLPPKPHRDMREWKRAGATVADVLCWAMAAPAVGRKWAEDATKAIEKRKQGKAVA